jgi:SAM-dependent MidA family methyltransferase
MKNSDQTFSLQDISSKGLERSRKLTHLISSEIRATSQQVISFDRFMSLALYADSLGYYVAGQEIFGTNGDFVTAPESGDLFGFCVAEQCAEILDENGVAITEFGAGTGALADTIIRYFDGKISADNFSYSIIEPSPYLSQRQKNRLSKMNSRLADKIKWYSTCPDEGFLGVAIANEVFDAMPARRFTIRRGEIKELGVAYDGENFIWEIMECSVIPELILDRMANYPEGYTTEHVERQGRWFAEFKKFMKRGILLVADYGYVDQDFFHLDRCDGTLRCYFKHHSNDNPFFAVGLQDITTSVNFSYLAECALSAGFTVDGFTSQAKFLMGNKLDDHIATLSAGDSVDAYRAAQEAKRLILPSQMGESFKFMACSYRLEKNMSGFTDNERFRLG